MNSETVLSFFAGIIIGAASVAIATNEPTNKPKYGKPDYCHTSLCNCEDCYKRKWLKQKEAASKDLDAPRMSKREDLNFW